MMSPTTVSVNPLSGSVEDALGATNDMTFLEVFPYHCSRLRISELLSLRRRRGISCASFARYVAAYRQAGQSTSSLLKAVRPDAWDAWPSV
jgi:hypothetical protein